MRIEKSGTFFKVSDDGIAYGWAIVCTENGVPYVDLQGDHIPEDVMVKALADFATSARVGKDQHQGDQTGEHVFIYPMTRDTAKGLGITTKKTGAIVGYKPSNASDLEKIRSGERTGFSIGGVVTESDGVAKAITKAAGAPATYRTFRAFKIHEISLVDRPAQEGATVGYVKNASGARRPVARTFSKQVVLTDLVDGHQHTLDPEDPACGWYGAFSTSYQTSEGADNGHSHAWVYDAVTGAISIAADSGHTHAVSAVVSPETMAAYAAREAAELADPCAPCEPCEPVADEPSGGNVTVMIAARAPVTSKSTPAITAPTVNNIKPSPTERTTMKTLEEQIADLTKRADRIRKLSTTEHALWKSLDAEIADAFLAKSVGDRAAEMTEFAKSNAVEYTADDGTTYTKSQGQMAKLHKMADDERKLRLDGEVAKRAADLFGAIAGPDDARINLLKRIESESDGTKREAMEAVIRAAAGVMKAAGVAKGAGGVGDPAVVDNADALEALEKGLVAFAKAQSITKNVWTDGLNAFVQTTEGAALKRAYDESRAG